MTIQINKDNCVSLGYCWGTCSTVFAEGSDGKAVVRSGQENSQAPCVLDAQAGCCPGAIEIV